MNKTKTKLHKYKNFLIKNFKHISLSLFVFGFILDYFTLPNVTSIYSIYIGGIFMLVIGTLIYIREILGTDKINIKNEDRYVNLLSLLIALLLGSFTSFVFVYYIRGGDIVANIPILFLILTLMLSNEFIKNKLRLYVDLITYSIATIFYFIFAVPYVLKNINFFSFLISLLISNMFLYFYLKVIFRFKKDILKYKLYNYLLIPSLFLSLIYISNIFPAVPLNLKYSGLYKEIKVSNINNVLSYDLISKIKRNIFLKNVIKKEEVSEINFYAELQAPSNLKGNITHLWEYHDTKSGAWVKINEVKYEIIGGREGGFRGYSKITNLNLGDYRIKVLLDNKRLAGKISFTVR